jgi:hypothetical protein
VSDRGSGGLTPRPPGNGGLRIGSLEGEPSVTLAAGDLEATFLPGLGLLGTSLRHRGQELLALPGGVAGYRDRHVTGLPLRALWAAASGATRPPGSRSTWAWTCPPTGRPADPAP